MTSPTPKRRMFDVKVLARILMRYETDKSEVVILGNFIDVAILQGKRDFAEKAKLPHKTNDFDEYCCSCIDNEIDALLK